MLVKGFCQYNKYNGIDEKDLPDIASEAKQSTFEIA